MIKIKRIYSDPAKDDGFRMLVDRLWPRGVSKEKAKIDLWLKDIAPSDSLRKWFNHDPAKWDEFKRKYFRELDENKDRINQVFKKHKGIITLLYAAKDDEHNNAEALKEYIEAE